MNESQRRKREFEHLLLGSFLDGSEYEFVPLPDEHGHDGWADRNGVHAMALELTAYAPDARSDSHAAKANRGSPRRASVVAWRKHVWPTLDLRRRAYQDLCNVVVSITFKEDAFPPQRVQWAEFTQQLFELVHATWRNREVFPAYPNCQVAQVRSVQLAENVMSSGRQRDRTYLSLDPRSPMAQYIESLWLMKVRRPWAEWRGPDLQPGFVDLNTDVLANVVKDKTNKAKHYDAEGLPLWLVIHCDAFEDVRTHIFPRDEHDYKCIRSGLQKLPDPVPFARVWLLSQWHRSRICLLPRSQYPEWQAFCSAGLSQQIE
ncbi:MAG: hypothetical protein WD042_10160 [Phycisphaeraceae bacterium]